MKIRFYPVEEWKPLDFPGIEKNYYEISNHGRVKNRKGKIINTTLTNPTGYRYVNLKREGTTGSIKKTVHRMVAYHFLGKEKFHTHTVNHINGNKNDATVLNLEYATLQENVRHAFRTGLNKPLKGTANGNSRFSDEVVTEVCQMISNGYSNGDIARHFRKLSMSTQYINRIRKGIIRRDISAEYLK